MLAAKFDPAQEIASNSPVERPLWKFGQILAETRQILDLDLIEQAEKTSLIPKGKCKTRIAKFKPFQKLTEKHDSIRSESTLHVIDE
jgi:hypothetical protein